MLLHQRGLARRGQLPQRRLQRCRLTVPREALGAEEVLIDRRRVVGGERPEAGNELAAARLTATVAREIVYSGCTKGMYPIVRDFIAGKGNEPTLPQRVASASATGFLGSIGANALDVVKIRQFDQPGRYAGGFLGALGEIAREEGLVRGLLIRGASASAPRGAAIAVGEVTTYDQVKSTLRRHYPDGFALHVVVSLITGVVATTVAAPFDLLKSRVMASADPADGFVQVLGRLLRNEGPLALFNGWLPTYCRLGPHAILTFPLYEAFRRLLGLDYL